MREAGKTVVALKGWAPAVLQKGTVAILSVNRPMGLLAFLAAVLDSLSAIRRRTLRYVPRTYQDEAASCANVQLVQLATGHTAGRRDENWDDLDWTYQCRCGRGMDKEVVDKPTECSKDERVEPNENVAEQSLLFCHVGSWCIRRTV